MRNRTSLTAFKQSLLALLLLFSLGLLASCGGHHDDDDDPAPGPTTGSLVVTISGLPAGVNGAVTVTGPASYSKLLTAINHPERPGARRLCPCRRQCGQRHRQPGGHAGDPASAGCRWRHHQRRRRLRGHGAAGAGLAGGRQRLAGADLPDRAAQATAASSSSSAPGASASSTMATSWPRRSSTSAAAPPPMANGACCRWRFIRSTPATATFSCTTPT